MSRTATWVRVVIAALVVIVVLAIVVSVVGDEGSGTPTTTSSSTSSSSSTTTPDDDEILAVWPFTGTAAVRDPVEVTRTFAVAYLGFTDPVIGTLQPSGSGAGRVEIRPDTRGPVTTADLHQRADGGWVVIGADTADIDLESPDSGAEIDSPVVLAGQALAFEGTVVVEVRQDGSAAPLGHGVVTGGGDVKRPFDGTIDFDQSTAPSGALVLYTESAKDGSVVSAVVIPVRFG